MIVPSSHGPCVLRRRATAHTPRWPPTEKRKKPFSVSQKGPRLGTRLNLTWPNLRLAPTSRGSYGLWGLNEFKGGRRPGPPSSLLLSPLPKFKPPLTLVARGEWAAPEARARRWLRPASHLSLLPAALTLSPTERAPKRPIHYSGLFLSADPLPSPHTTPFNQLRTQVKQGLRCPLLLLS